MCSPKEAQRSRSSLEPECWRLVPEQEEARCPPQASSAPEQEARVARALESVAGKLGAGEPPGLHKRTVSLRAGCHHK